MRYYDIFNGDADGICALIQLRLVEPREAELITGVKRDIKLLANVQPQAGDVLCVLDISMDKNKSALQNVLNAGAKVFYCDHHFAGEIPQHTALDAKIDTAADTCTSLIINQMLGDAYVNWAITAAYGDNMLVAAEALAAQHGLSSEQKEALKTLGIAINYNGYGANVSDLHIHPAELYQALLGYADPLELIAQNAPIYCQLVKNYQTDMQQIEQAEEIYNSSAGRVFVLPNQPWARRVSGVWGNQLANQAPELAHAVLTRQPENTFLVSVRAPKSRAEGADSLCMKFATGGGRKAAAGINMLASTEVSRFIAEFDQQFKV